MAKKKKSWSKQLEELLSRQRSGRKVKAPKEKVHHRIEGWEKHIQKLLKKEYKQVGIRKSKKLDYSHKALHSGWRKSKATGNLYFEARKNRSDKKGTRL